MSHFSSPLGFKIIAVSVCILTRQLIWLAFPTFSWILVPIKCDGLKLFTKHFRGGEQNADSVRGSCEGGHTMAVVKSNSPTEKAWWHHLPWRGGWLSPMKMYCFKCHNIESCSASYMSVLDTACHPQILEFIDFITGIWLFVVAVLLLAYWGMTCN